MLVGEIRNIKAISRLMEDNQLQYIYCKQFLHVTYTQIFVVNLSIIQIEVTNVTKADWLLLQ